MDRDVRSDLGRALHWPGEEPNGLEQGLDRAKNRLKRLREDLRHPYKKNGKPWKESTIKLKEGEARGLERKIADYHEAFRLHEEILVRTGAKPKTKGHKKAQVAYLKVV